MRLIIFSGLFLAGLAPSQAVTAPSQVPSYTYEICVDYCITFEANVEDYPPDSPEYQGALSKCKKSCKKQKQ